MINIPSLWNTAAHPILSSACSATSNISCNEKTGEQYLWLNNNPRRETPEGKPPKRNPRRETAEAKPPKGNRRSETLEGKPPKRNRRSETPEGKNDAIVYFTTFRAAAVAEFRRAGEPREPHHVCAPAATQQDSLKSQINKKAITR